MIMDTTKKYLYFNNDTGDTDGSVMMPVSTCVGFETTGASDVKFYFKSAPDTDTLDIQLDGTADSNPRELFEQVVNAINFSKDAVVTVGDDFTGEYIHPDITAVNNISDAADSIIKFQGHVQSNIGFANGAGDDGPARASNVGNVNSEIVSTFLIDLAQSGSVSSGGTGEHDVIGQAGTDGAYFTQITKAINGIVYGGEMICVEEPTGASAAVGLGHNASSTLSQDDAISSTHLIDDATQTLGKKTTFTANITDNHYLYLFHGGSGSATTYGAGKFLVRLFGADDVSL